MNLMKGQILSFLSEKAKYGNEKESKRLLEHYCQKSKKLYH